MSSNKKLKIIYTLIIWSTYISLELAGQDHQVLVDLFEFDGTGTLPGLPFGLLLAILLVVLIPKEPRLQEPQPVVLEVIVYLFLHLVSDSLRQRLPSTAPWLLLVISGGCWAGAGLEASDKGEPVREGRVTVDRVVAHALVVARNDVNERTHDVRKEGHAAKHYNTAQNYLVLRPWQEVTIPRSCQCRYRKVASCH